MNALNMNMNMNMAAPASGASSAGTRVRLSYWAERTGQSRHPILKARYADLVWDFSRHVTGKIADPAMARIVITANVEIAQRRLYEHDFDLAGRLKRALSLALQINDAELLQKVKETTISSEAYFSAKGNFKHRGFSYDLLVENNRIQLTDSESREIIFALEQWLDIVSNAENQELFDPFAAEEAALPRSQVRILAPQPPH